MKKIVLLSLLLASACSTKPLTPSVPTKDGHNAYSAKVALDGCAQQADEGGTSAVVGAYATNILLWGIIVGPVATAPFEDQLRAQGEIDQVDRCMGEQGFERRELTQGESFWLRNSFGQERERRLNHLIGGGTIETYGSPT